MDKSVSLAHAIAHSYQNRAEVERSESCACFWCYARFKPSEITLWSDSIDPDDEDPGRLRPDSDRFRGTTAICPRCRNEDVIGSASGYDLTDDFLRALNKYWHVCYETPNYRWRGP
jgi:hypothetical protein